MVGCALAAGLMLLFVRGFISGAIAFPGLLIGLAILFMNASKIPKWRCKACGTRWGEISLRNR